MTSTPLVAPRTGKIIIIKMTSVFLKKRRFATKCY